MSKYIHNRDVSALFQIGEQFKNRCLINESSMFTDERLWTSENSKHLISDFVNNPDEGDRNFIDKLEEQLKRSSSSVKKLAAEMLYMLLLCPSNIGTYKKREVVETVWNWSGDSLNMSASFFSDEVLQGAGSAGTAFNTGRWREFNYIINFIDKWTAVAKPDQIELLNDKWKFAKWLEIVPENEVRQFRHMILYMLYPDSFERIFSYGDRIKIVSMYTGLRAKDIRKSYSAFDMDKKLLDIRNNLIVKNNGDENVDFYIKPWDGWRSDGDISHESSVIPENISREHMLKAIEQIDLQGIPNNAKSTTYDLVYKGQRYPPKYVVSLANLYANGFVLNRDSFGGGLGTECFNVIEQSGFEIVMKSENSENLEIKKALTNVCDFLKKYKNTGPYKSNDEKLLGVKSSINAIAKYLENNFQEYRGVRFKVKESEGVGIFPTIPYLCILPPGQKVNDGVYVALCFGKDGNGFVLGCAESNTQSRNLPVVIRKGNGVIPAIDVDGVRPGTRYNNTFANPLEVYIDIFDENKFNRHIQSSIDLAIKYLGISMDNEQELNSFKLNKFTASLKQGGVQVNESMLYRYCALLTTKKFLILTGLSGSGKTQIAMAFSKWLSADRNQYLIVPVGADWTNREPLVGYPNALNPNEYVVPDSGVIDLVIQAALNPSLPYFLILDEMNMSHVERYFSDFLSLMESGGELKLHSSNQIRNVPKSIVMPNNLFIIGTVNIDETTYMFSPKVLDRAGVIEFRVANDDMKSFLESPIKPDMAELTGLGKSMASDFVRIASEDSPMYINQKQLNNELIKFFDELKNVNAEFGYRTAFEINRFAGIISFLSDGEYDQDDIVDAAIIQKLLPKLHGSRNQLVPVLEKLAALCLKDEAITNVKAKLKVDQVASNDPDVKYPLSFEKIHRMHSRAIKDGFTSFAEA